MSLKIPVIWLAFGLVVGIAGVACAVTEAYVDYFGEECVEECEMYGKIVGELLSTPPPRGLDYENYTEIKDYLASIGVNHSEIVPQEKYEDMDMYNRSAYVWDWQFWHNNRDTGRIWSVAKDYHDDHELVIDLYQDELFIPTLHAIWEPLFIVGFVSLMWASFLMIVHIKMEKK